MLCWFKTAGKIIDHVTVFLLSIDRGFLKILLVIHASYIDVQLRHDFIILNKQVMAYWHYSVMHKMHDCKISPLFSG